MSVEGSSLETRVFKEEVRKAEEAYLKISDWEVKENANTSLSYSNFRNYLFEKLVKRPEVLSQFLPPKAVKMHFSGDIHIHKLPDSLWIPYCAGWSYERILRKGLRTPNVISRPAKHFDTAVAHLVNFFFIGAQEWTGAQAVSAFDLYLGPFVEHDSLDHVEIKQVLQGMLFELNYPARAGYQSPFTNITLMLDTSPKLLEGRAYVSGEPVGTLGDFLDGAKAVAKALFELYLEGDAVSQPFTFPIPTIMLTKNFDWSGRRWGDLVDLVFEALARRGTAYLLNGYATDVEALYAMCCRLTIDTKKVLLNGPIVLSSDDGAGDTRKNAHGIWAIPDATGSIGVVTINLPRVAYLSRGEWDRFVELLEERLAVAREVLLAWRKRYETSLRAGLMPLTKEYIGHLNNHYNTIGVIGLPEAAANFMRAPDVWLDSSSRGMREAVSIMKNMVSYIRKRVEEFEEEDGYLYNVEEVPGEGASYRLARLDARRLGADAAIPSYDSTPFYSNSAVPYYADVPVFRRAMWEGEVQGEFTGGVMMHLFLSEQPDPEALKKLVRRIAENTKVVYFSITPAISVCRSCGWSAVGVFEECPKCHGPVDVWSRIVGYYRPIRTWNPGKQAEFRTRKHYAI